MDSLRFPIEYNETGFAKLDDGSDSYYKQLLSISALTEPGILRMTPDFGVYDPTFQSADKGQFLINASRFVPEVQIIKVVNNIDGDGSNTISFTFRRRQ
jgi:hypothetical protein